MTDQTKTEEGWHRPPGSRKFHYFIDGGGRSVCMNWGFAFSAELEPHKKGNPEPGKEDCKRCWREAEKR